MNDVNCLTCCCNRPCCPPGGAVSSVPVCLQLTEEDLETNKLDPKEVFTCSLFLLFWFFC